jgi:hypothetical protein
MTHELITPSTAIRTPSVMELPPVLEPVTRDPFIDDLAPAFPIAAPDEPIPAARAQVER